MSRNINTPSTAACSVCGKQAPAGLGSQRRCKCALVQGHDRVTSTRQRLGSFSHSEGTGRTSRQQRMGVLAGNTAGAATWQLRGISKRATRHKERTWPKAPRPSSSPSLHTCTEAALESLAQLWVPPASVGCAINRRCLSARQAGHRRRQAAGGRCRRRRCLLAPGCRRGVLQGAHTCTCPPASWESPGCAPWGFGRRRRAGQSRRSPAPCSAAVDRLDQCRKTECAAPTEAALPLQLSPRPCGNQAGIDSLCRMIRRDGDDNTPQPSRQGVPPPLRAAALPLQRAVHSCAKLRPHQRAAAPGQSLHKSSAADDVWSISVWKFKLCQGPASKPRPDEQQCKLRGCVHQNCSRNNAKFTVHTTHFGHCGSISTAARYGYRAAKPTTTAQPPGQASATLSTGVQSRTYVLLSYCATAAEGLGGACGPSPCCPCCPCCCCAASSSSSAAAAAHSRAAATWHCHTISVGHTKPTETCQKGRGEHNLSQPLLANGRYST